MPAVQATYGPTLPELIGPRLWRVVCVLAVVVAVVAAVAVLKPGGANESVLVGRGAVEFNFVYDPPLREAGPAKVETVRDGVFVQSMSVEPLPLPAYRGDVGGTLPIVADRLTDRLAAAHPGFRLVQEGRTRINDAPGYFVAWEAKLGDRKLFGKEYLLTPDEPGVRAGAHLHLMSTYAGAVTNAVDVGTVGALKRSLRSFRFGTERP